MRSTHFCTVIRTLAFMVAAAAAVLPAPARGQGCGLNLTRTVGGQTRAVAQINSSLVLAATGTDVHIVNAPTPATMTNLGSGSPRLVLSSPVVKLSMTPGSTRAFALLENGGVAVIAVASVGFVGPFPNALSLVEVREYDAVDILANGTQAWVVRRYEASTAPYDQSNYSQVDYIDGATAGGSTISTVLPYINTMFFDRLTRIGNTIWVGMHAHLSNIYGVAGYSFTFPSSPSSVTNSLNITTSFQYNSISAMTAIGNRIFMAYGQTGHFIRAVDVSTPTSPGWLTETNIGGLTVNDLGSSGNLLHIAWTPAALTIWDVTNPTAPSAQGTFSGGGVPAQVLVTSGTDYVAFGAAGLIAVNTSNPAAMTQRAAIAPQPANASIVRQSGTNTVIADYLSATMRLYDYTGVSAVAHGVLNVTDPPSLMEISVQGSSSYACIANDTPITTVRIYDISNPDVLFFRGSYMAPGGVTMMSCTGSRLYLFVNTSLLVVDISNPQIPVLRSQTAFGGGVRYNAMESWANAVALGTDNGLWFIDTTNAAAPVVRSTYTPPAERYNVQALGKSAAELYASVAATPSGDMFYHPQIDSFNVLNLSAPGLEGTLPRSDLAQALTFASPGSNRFMVVSENAFEFFGVSPRLSVLDLASAAVPTEIAALNFWGEVARPAVSADGSQLFVASGAGGVEQFAAPTQWAPVFFRPILSNVASCLGGAAVFISGLPPVTASPAATFQWLRTDTSGASTVLTDGPTPWGSVVSGSQTPTLRISSLHASDTGVQTPGGAYSYSCRATNSCGSDFTSGAHIVICRADFNCSGAVSVQDIFDFLAAYFSGNSFADINGSGAISVQDIFDFLAAYFAGCP